MDVQCDPLPRGHAKISVTYTLTAVSADGETFVHAFLRDDAYTRFIGEWETALTAALDEDRLSSK